ncbi:MAG: EamA family transporter RarD [Actinobacteria bacterium]|nr:EamA family transporter RarD [Actinomycetota bacterium]MDA2952582.1 EamA family transporter RarD [Actinomycetota bacterium]MDA2999189.1 EamA family transporter RarD [Actinomycetota bacterium]
MSQPAHRQDTSQAAVALSFSVYFLWGALTLYWKELQDFDPFELIGWRIASSVVVLVVVMSATRRLRPLLIALRTPQLFLRISLASILLTINWATYVWAVVNDHVLETALGYFIAPVLTIVIGVSVLHERLRMIQKVAVAFAVGGIAVLTIAYGRVPWIAITIASSWSFYAYLKKKVPLQPLESLTAEVLVLAVPAIAFLFATWNNVDSVSNTANFTEWIFVAFTGVITAIPLLMFASASQRTPLTILGPMQYIVPTMNFLIGWLLFDELLTTSKVAGFALIWVCLALVLTDLFRTQRQQQNVLSPQ